MRGSTSTRLSTRVTRGSRRCGASTHRWRRGCPPRSPGRPSGSRSRSARTRPPRRRHASDRRPRRGKVRRGDACVGRVEAHVQERRAQQEQEREGRNEDRHGPAHHPPRESCGVPRPLVAHGPADRESVEAVAEDRQQGRQQRQRGRDGEGDDDRPRDPDRAQDHELEQHEPEQAEQDREAAEEHGAPGGRHGDAHGGGDAIRFELRLFGELLAEPAREQERVVDAQAKPQKGRQVEHEDAHRRELGDDEDRRHRDQDARPADHERHAAATSDAKTISSARAARGNEMTSLRWRSRSLTCCTSP